MIEKIGKRKIRDEQKGLIFIILIVLVMIAAIIFFIRMLQTDAVEEQLKNDDIVRVLYVVEDYDQSVLFSNVLIYYPKHQKGAVINLPNNTGDIFTTLGRVDKISDVYKESGILGFKTEVEKLLGVKIPFYTIFTQENFIKITDLLGGMRVFIPAPVDFASEDDKNERWLLPSGALTLDGDKISTYVHYHLPDESDSDAEDRYLNVQIALLSGFNENSFTIFSKDNFGRFADCMIVNLDKEDVKTLYSIIAEIDTESITRQTINGSLRNVDGQQLLFPLNNGEFIKEAVRQTTSMLLSNDGTVPTRGYVLEIQNGTTVQGLARNTAILFQNASYDVLSAINADSNDYEHTVIIDHVGNEEVARLIGDFIHCDNIKGADEPEKLEVLTSDTEAKVDYTIILGRDFDGRYVRKNR